MSAGEELSRFNLSDAGPHQSTVMASLYKCDGAWKARRVGASCAAKFCSKYTNADALVQGFDGTAAKMPKTVDVAPLSKLPKPAAVVPAAVATVPRLVKPAVAPTKGKPGRVTKFFEDKGFGSIVLDDSTEVFFHVSSLKCDMVAVNDKVDCQTCKNGSSLRVSYVNVTGKAPDMRVLCTNSICNGNKQRHFEDRCPRGGC